MSVQPTIQRFLSAAEIAEFVLSPQRLRRRVGHRERWLLENAWLREELAKAVWNTGRPVQKLRELLPVWFLELELSPIGKNPTCLTNGGKANEAGVAGFR
jgi:hypothetical protein